jgi:hypothetical protein
MCNGTVMLCGHCGRPVIQGVGMSVTASGRIFHYECARSPYASEQASKELNAKK